MKEKNLVIGERYVVKENTECGVRGFNVCHIGKVVTLIDNDFANSHNLKVMFPSGEWDWGNAKGLRKLKEGEK